MVSINLREDPTLHQRQKHMAKYCFQLKAIQLGPEFEVVASITFFQPHFVEKR